MHMLFLCSVTEEINCIEVIVLYCITTVLWGSTVVLVQCDWAGAAEVSIIALSNSLVDMRERGRERKRKRKRKSRWIRRTSCRDHPWQHFPPPGNKKERKTMKRKTPPLRFSQGFSSRNREGISSSPFSPVRQTKKKVPVHPSSSLSVMYVVCCR